LPGGIVAGGAAGFVLGGMVDAGVKIPVLREGQEPIGLAIGYDLLDVFGVAGGAAGVAFLGAGAGGAGLVAVGGANLQFNLFSLAMGKHWGRSHLTWGTFLLDNHHYVPQAEGFAAACGAGGVGDAGDGGVVTPCGSAGGKIIDRMPTQVQPFVGFERAIGEESALSAEILFSRHVKYTVAATGVRWFIWHRGPLRARLDIGLVWSQVGYPLPWAGLGLHFR
jgi:hypothetical protein